MIPYSYIKDNFFKLWSKVLAILLLFSLYFSSLNLKYLKLIKMELSRFAMKLFIYRYTTIKQNTLYTNFIIIFFIFQQLKSQISQIDQNGYNPFCDETIFLSEAFKYDHTGRPVCTVLLVTCSQSTLLQSTHF